MKHYSKAEKHSYFKGFFKGLDKGRNKNCSRVDYSGIDSLIHSKAVAYKKYCDSKFHGLPNYHPETVADIEKRIRMSSSSAEQIFKEF